MNTLPVDRIQLPLDFGHARAGWVAMSSVRGGVSSPRVGLSDVRATCRDSLDVLVIEPDPTSGRQWVVLVGPTGLLHHLQTAEPALAGDVPAASRFGVGTGGGVIEFRPDPTGPGAEVMLVMATDSFRIVEPQFAELYSQAQRQLVTDRGTTTLI